MLKCYQLLVTAVKLSLVFKELLVTSPCANSGRGIANSEERFKTIFEQAPLGIALIDSLHGHIYEVNPLFANIAQVNEECEY